jgi:hypothetical protein
LQVVFLLHKKKHARIEAMLTNMKVLAESNPAIVRLGLDTLAELAIEDAAKSEPQLWTQGRGQKTEYLEEARSDIRYREIYLDLSKTA